LTLFAATRADGKGGPLAGNRHIHPPLSSCFPGAGSDIDGIIACFVGGVNTKKSCGLVPKYSAKATRAGRRFNQVPPQPVVLKITQ